MRPTQSSQILPTCQLVGKPRPELLIGPRIVTPADRTPILSHDHNVLHSSRYAGCVFENDLVELDANGTLAAAEANEHTLITAET